MKVRVLRAFTDENLRFGNPLGLVEDASALPDPQHRQDLAAALGFSESVFIDDIESAKVSFYSSQRAVPFAGHAAVGVAWALRQLLGRIPDALQTDAGDCEVWVDGSVTWDKASLATTPGWWHERVSSTSALEALDGPLSPDQDMTQLWAWVDENEGVMRVRTFAGRAGITEDEACGSGAMRMAAAFGRPLTLRHGRGSLIFARPGPPGRAAIGGYVAEDALRNVNRF